jgi:hypothetical protein
MRGKQRGGLDQIDQWCQAWARQRRIALGIADLEIIEPAERLGQLRCTLGKVKVEAEGASYTVSKQNFPEVYTGTSLHIHRGCALMPANERLSIHLHYVWREVPAEEKRKTIPASIGRYWTLLSQAKSFLNGYMSVNFERSVAA